jgi:hypothetical protein
MEGYAVVLDTQLNDFLLREGYLRDLVHQIQLLRKEAGFEVEDRIRIGVNDGQSNSQDLIQGMSSLYKMNFSL